MILPKNVEAMENFPIEVKHRVKAILMHKNDSVMTCTVVIMSVANTPKNIYLSNNLFTEFESRFFQSKEVYFSYISRST